MNWKTAFITGGASGIGRRFAELLLQEQVQLAVFDRSNDPKAKAELEAWAQSQGGSCTFFRADVSDAAGIESAVRSAVAELGPPGLALNCAGIQDARPFLEQDAESFSRVVSVNLVGSRHFAAAVLPHMAQGSQLALVASLAGLVPSYHYAAYNASKFGVVGLAGALRLECVERGVDVSVICPPEINTPMVEIERKTMTDTGKKLKGTAGTLEVGPACDYMLKQLKRRQYMIIPGFRARGVARFGRLFPRIMRYFSERIVKTAA